MAWLPGTSVMSAPARADIAFCAGYGIILSSATRRYQLGLVLHAGSVMAPARASTPQPTCESAMKAAVLWSTSPAKADGILALSRVSRPPTGGRIGGGA